MQRYLRIYFALQRASVQSSMAYRANVIIMVLTGALWQGGGLAIVLVVLAHFHTLAGWDFRDVAFLYGLRLMAHATWLTPLGSLTGFDFAVRYGDFDQMLLRPVNLFVQATTRPRWFLGLGDGVLAVGVFTAAVLYAPVHWTPGRALLCAVFIGAGALIESSAWVVVAALAFSMTATSQIGQLTDGAMGTLGSYPLNIFGATTQRVLTFGVPIAFVAYLASALLLGKTNGLVVPSWVAYLAPAAGALCFSLAVWFWSRQARHYQSTGQ